MAKKSTDEYLAGILNVLDDILKESKNSAKTGGQTNAPAGSGVVLIDSKSADVLGNSLKVLSSALPPLAKISAKEYETVANGIKILGEAISSFKLDKDALVAVGNAISAFVLIHNVITNLSENFVRSILSLNPLKAWILGKRLGRFYGLVAKGMAKAFMQSLVDVINVIPPNKNVKNATFLKRLTNLGLMMTALLKITPKDIMQLWFMGVMLGPKIGGAIGGFFKELIDKLAGGPNGVAKANAAAKVAMSVSAMIGVLSLSLIALVLLFKMNKWEDLLGGSAMLVGIVGLSLGIIAILGSKKFKREANQALVGAKQVLVLIAGLTLSLIALVLLAKGASWEEIGKGSAMLVGIVGLSLLISWVLGKLNREKTEALEGVGAVLLLIVGLSVVALLVKRFAKDAKDITIGMGMAMLFAAGAIGLLYLLSKVAQNKQTMINGIIGTGAVVLMMAGMAGAMLIFGNYLEKIHNITLKDAALGIGLMAALVTGVIGMATAISAVMSSGIGAGILLVGVAGVELIALMVASISGAMLKFTEMLEKVRDLKLEDINDAVNKILGTSFGKNPSDNELPEDNASMIGALGAIIKGMAGFGVKMAAKAAVISVALRPVITTISQFVDVVQKMASLKIADEWDPKTGKPTHYLQLTPEAFKTAAKNLTESFSTFLSDLSTGLAGFDLKSIAVINLLFPRQSKMSKWLTGEKPGIGAVIHMLGDFIDIIQKMGSLAIPDSWDKDGKPISYRLMQATEFKDFAVALSGALGDFVTELGTGLQGVSVKAALALKVLAGPLGQLLPSIGSIMLPIMQIAVGKLAVGDKVLDLNLTNMKKASTDIVLVIKALIEPMKDLSARGVNTRAIKNVVDNFSYVLESFGKFADSFVFKDTFTNLSQLAIDGFTKFVDFLTINNFAQLLSYAEDFEDMLDYMRDGIVPFMDKVKISQFNNDFIVNCGNLSKGFNKLIGFLLMQDKKGDSIFGSPLYGDATIVKNAKNFKNMLKHTSEGIAHISPYLKATPQLIKDLAQAFKELDQELISKEEQRSKAIMTVSSNFKNMADNVKELNQTLSESTNLSNSYNRLRENTDQSFLQRGTTILHLVNDSVLHFIELHAPKTPESQKEAIEKAQQEQNKILGITIANAITAAMDAWYADHRDLTVQLAGGQKIFGELYGL